MSSACKVDGCKKPARRCGWCGMHHQRWLRHRDLSRDRAIDEGRAAAIRLCEETIPAPGTRLIPLTKGRVAIVDEQDFERLSAFKWCVQSTPKGNLYASRHDGDTMVLMHREILGVPDDINVDHRNWDGLDNRRDNLREATQARNSLNHPGHKVKVSRFKGVYFHRQNQNWVASFRHKHLGCFATEEEAASAYDAAAFKADPEFAYLNFPEGLQCQA